MLNSLLVELTVEWLWLTTCSAASVTRANSPFFFFPFFFCKSWLNYFYWSELFMLRDGNDLWVLIRVEELSKHNVGGWADGYVIYGDAMNSFFTSVPTDKSASSELFWRLCFMRNSFPSLLVSRKKRCIFNHWTIQGCAEGERLLHVSSDHGARYLSKFTHIREPFDNGRCCQITSW